MWPFTRPSRRPLVSRRAAPRPRCHPRLEQLEGRLAPAAGALDPTFGSGGIVTTDLGARSDAVFAAALQTDGKVVAVGRTATSGAGQVFGLARYLPGGALDPTFGSGGIVRTDVTSKGTSESATAVALQPDGKIVVVGSATVGQTQNTFPTLYDNALVVARYNPNGTLDKTFNKTGILLVNPTRGDDEGTAVAVQPDGKILVGGWTNHTAATGYSTVTGNDFFLARVTAAGALDGTFGSGGMVSTDFHDLSTRPDAISMDSLHQIRVLSDGRILAAGGMDLGFALARYTPAGALDPTFGTGGKAAVPVGFNVDSDRIGLGFGPGGTLVLGGSLWDSAGGAQYDLVVARTDADGAPDPTFGGTGVVRYGLGVVGDTTYDERSGGLVVQPGGAVVAAGTREVSQGGVGVGRSLFFVRFTAEGVPDPGFGSGGEVTGPAGSGASTLLQQPDGRLLVAGTSARATNSGTDYDFFLARYLVSAPQIGAFTASSYSPPPGGSVTLTAGGITDGNPDATVTRVAFYLDANGDGVLDPAVDTLLGYGTRNADGTWSATSSTAGWPAGTDTVFAQATDSYGVLGDPVARTLEVL